MTDKDVHLKAQADGGGSVYQAGRDQHLHFRDGQRIATRVTDDGEQLTCPYPGLAAFGSREAQWFFGRDRPVAQVCQRLDGKLTEPGPLLIIGPSGVGKSSLLRAGVVPAIERGTLPAAGSRDWPRLLLTPTADPMLALAEQVSGLAGGDPETMARSWWADPGQCVLVLRGLGDHVLVLVDQFEEIFTLCADEQRRRAFIDLLDELASCPPGIVLICVRADFYDACIRYGPLRKALRASPILLEPMSMSELREAILFPAERVGLDIEPGLIEVLLRDAGMITDAAPAAAGEENREDRAGRLPLLAHALRSTWQQKHGHLLTLEGYELTGGITNAIATTAEQVFASLDEEGQWVTRAVFLRLVNFGEYTDATRRRVSRLDLLRDLPGERAAEVMAAYTRKRLLTQETESVAITHEALLHAWPRLRDWIDVDRTGNLVRQQLDEAAAAWVRDRRDPSALYRGSRLVVAADWARTHASDLTQNVRDFLAASHQAQHRARTFRRFAFAGLTLLTVAAVVAAGLALNERSTAITQRDNAFYGAIDSAGLQLSPVDPSLASQFFLAADHLNGPASSTVTSDLVSASNFALSSPLPLTGLRRAFSSEAYSPDGQLLASGNGDGMLRIWRVADPAHPRLLTQIPVLGGTLRGGPTGLESVAFRPDGQLLATADFRNVVWLWDVTDPVHPRAVGAIPLGATDSAYTIVFSPDGHTLATGGFDGTLRLWDVTDPAFPRQIGSVAAGNGTVVYAVAFSPGTHTLVTGNGAGQVRLWDVTDLAHPRAIGNPLVTETSPVFSVVFSPDGQMLAAAGGDAQIRLWYVVNLARPTPLGQPFTAHSDTIFSLAFSPDGRMLASGSADDSVKLWDVANPVLVTAAYLPLTAHTGPVSSVAFSPDGHTLSSASYDGNIRQWNLPRTVLIGAQGAAVTQAFRPDGRILAVGDSNGTTRLWDVTSPLAAVPAGAPLSTGGSVFSVAFRRDGRVLAIVSKSAATTGLLQFWDVTDPGRPRPLSSVPTSGAAYSVAFSPDGHTVADGVQDGHVQVWDATDPAHPRQTGSLPGHTKQVSSLAFSPDGRTLASGSYDDLVIMWNVADPRHPVPLGRPLALHNNYVTSVAFSPDGRTLASGSYDGTVIMWNVTDPGRPVLDGVPLSSSDVVTSVAFSPDGHTLASGSFSRSVWLWNVADPAHATQIGLPLSGHTNRVMSVAFSPHDLLVSGSSDDTVRLWDRDKVSVRDRICAASGGDLTPAAWRRYAPGPPYQPPCPTTAETPLSPPSPAALTGTWTGTYYCAQGETGVRFVIVAAPDGDLTVTTYFYPLPGQPVTPSGSLIDTGTYSAYGIYFKGSRWISQPRNYFMGGYNAYPPGARPRVLTGTLNSSSCTTFSVTKSSS